MASIVPSGLNAHLVRVPSGGDADGLAGGQVPQPHRAIAAVGASILPSGLNATPFTPLETYLGGCRWAARWPGSTAAPCRGDQHRGCR